MFVANMMTHPAGTGRENRQVRASLFLQPELGALETVPDLLVRDINSTFLTNLKGILFKR
jgi:hypothetical protein